MMLNVGDIVGGFGDENGITLHKVVWSDSEEVRIEVCKYEPGDPDFVWAIEQLTALEQN